MKFLTLSIIFVSYSIACVFCNDESKNSTVSSTEVPTSEKPATSTNLVNTSCESFTTCSECIGGDECFFCQADNKCYNFNLKDVLASKECSLQDTYYAKCSISLLAVVILISAGAGIVLIGIIACCCCCFCCKGSRFKLSRDDAKWARQRAERRAQAQEKRKDRAQRTEEIRRKYGLFKDDTPYQKFDD